MSLRLVATSHRLPGLLPARAWAALASSRTVLVAPDGHPMRDELVDAGVPVVAAPPVPRAAGKAAGGAVGAWADALLADAEGGGLAWLEAPRGDPRRDRGADDDLVRALRVAARARGWRVDDVGVQEQPPGTAVLDLVAVMARLRAPGGCPWDREQDHASLGRYAVEEVYELLEAIEHDEPAMVCEELGDLLLQVVFHARIAEDDGRFDVDDVAAGIAAKLVRRHPHVFADTTADTPAEVAANWEQLKAAEKPDRRGPFDGVPTALPALQLAEKYQRRAARVGAELSSAGEALERARTGLTAFAEAADPETQAAELGDLLAAVVDLARWHDIDPEAALRASAARFRRRLEQD